MKKILIRAEELRTGKVIKLDIKEHHKVGRIVEIILKHMGRLYDTGPNTYILDGKRFTPQLTIGDLKLQGEFEKNIIIASSLLRITPEPIQSIQDESDWRSAIQYIYVIRKSGILIFSQDLRENKQSKPSIHEDLLASALSGISSLVKDILKNKIPLKAIKQEGYNILLEESDELFVVVLSFKEYNTIRAKMKAFLKDFQDFFEEIIDRNDITVFLPTKKLVTKHFG
ncbi:MAG: hypothetical protein ACFFCS_21635 [Candidatus Hodarchaeota archaeon]